MNILKPKVSHLIKWKRAINTWWNELPCLKHSFTSGWLFWEIHFYQTQRPNFYLRFISFPSVLIQATFTLKPIYVPSSQEMHRKWDVWVRDREEKEREAERTVTELRLKRNHWCVKAYSTIRALLCDSRVRRQQRGEEKSRGCEWFSGSKESIWELLQGQKCNPWASVEVTTWCFIGLFVLPLAFWQLWACCVWQCVHVELCHIVTV